SVGAVSLRSGLGRLAELEVRRADAQLQLSRYLVGRLTPRGGADFEARDNLQKELSAAQRRLYQHLRQADQLLPLADAGSRGDAPPGRMRDENAALMAGESFKGLRAEAERTAQQSSVPRAVVPPEEGEETDPVRVGSGSRGVRLERGTAFLGWD